MAVGFKPAGGIRTAKQRHWLALMKEELGNSWLEPGTCSASARGMLADIERQLEFHVTGRYAAGITPSDCVSQTDTSRKP